MPKPKFTPLWLYELQSLMSDDEILEVAIQVNKNRKMDALKIVRQRTGFSLLAAIELTTKIGNYFK